MHVRGENSEAPAPPVLQCLARIESVVSERVSHLLLLFPHDDACGLVACSDKESRGGRSGNAIGSTPALFPSLYPPSLMVLAAASGRVVASAGLSNPCSENEATRIRCEAVIHAGDAASAHARNDRRLSLAASAPRPPPPSPPPSPPALGASAHIPCAVAGERDPVEAAEWALPERNSGCEPALGRFRRSPLPVLCTLSRTRGAAVVDADADAASPGRVPAPATPPWDLELLPPIAALRRTRQGSATTGGSDKICSRHRLSPRPPALLLVAVGAAH